MIDRRLALLLLVFCACKPAPPQTAKPGPAGPQVKATVLTLRTTIQPGDRVATDALLIAGDRARFNAEQDTWRLFDTRARTVTFVDDIAQTVRTESLDSLKAKRATALASKLPSVYPSATLTVTGVKKALLNVPAEQAVLELGGYRRELWLAVHPSIPDDLFALIQASTPPSSPLAPMMREADEALLETKGFPLADRAEIAYGQSKSVVDRVVLGIGQRNVPEATLTLPKEYRDVTPAPKK